MNELEKQLAEYQATLADKTLEELQALEQEIIAQAQELDKDAAEKVFTLKESDGTDLSATRRTLYGSTIASFLGKIEVNWQQALLVNMLIEFWNGKELDVKFPVLDNTLRMLGQVKFTGVDDFKKVAEVNMFFESIREEFMTFTNKLFEVANRHDVVMKEMQSRKASNEPAEA